MRCRSTRSAPSFSTTAATTAIATRHSRSRAATTSPAPAPTTRLPSCMGTHSGTKSQSGRPLTARNTFTSAGGMTGPRAPTTEPARARAPTTHRPQADDAHRRDPGRGDGAVAARHGASRSTRTPTSGGPRSRGRAATCLGSVPVMRAPDRRGAATPPPGRVHRRCPRRPPPRLRPGPRPAGARRRRGLVGRRPRLPPRHRVPRLRRHRDRPGRHRPRGDSPPGSASSASGSPSLPRRAASPSAGRPVRCRCSPTSCAVPPSSPSAATAASRWPRSSGPSTTPRPPPGDSRSSPPPRRACSAGSTPTRWRAGWPRSWCPSWPTWGASGCPTATSSAGSSPSTPPAPGWPRSSPIATR